jgi:threonylcarbamoyladenosine tRNA methylthiotransferase MtaB
MYTVAIATLGCKTNQYDTAVIEEGLARSSFQIIPFDQPADGYIINTCTVTKKTDYQSRQLVRRALRLNPDAYVIVTGCYVQVAPEAVESIEGVSCLVGVNQKHLIPQILEDELINPSGKKKRYIMDTDSFKEVSDTGINKFPGRSRAIVKIQEGCNAGCTYCVVPQARGPSRSVPSNKVLSEVQRLSDAGYLEVILTGTRLGLYGLDLEEDISFLNLLESLVSWSSKCEKHLSFRISSLDPEDIDSELIAYMLQEPLICPHYHISVQSGSSSVLARMGRNYDTNLLASILKDIRNELPEAAIGADFIVGFPGETEKEFQETKLFIEAMPFTYLHVFPYSKRPGSQAVEMEGHIAPEVIKKRAKILRQIGIAKNRKFMGTFKKKYLKVMVEKKDDKGSKYKGKSDNYLSVIMLNCQEDYIGKMVMVKVTSIFGNELVGNIIEVL